VSGWLVDQLPRVMAQDRVLRGFVLALEEVADSVRERVSGIERQVDVDLAPPEMLQYVAGWLGVDLEPSETGVRQRELVRAVGRTLGWRGTRQGVETILEAATGSRVTVTDSGGVFGPADDVPPPDPSVVVSLDSTGPLSEDQVRAFLAAELPLGAVLRLDVRYPQEEEP
jgi:phage tail-like protein